MDTHLHAYWIIAIGLIFAYIFYNIYLHDKKEDPHTDVSGIQYLAIALLIWALSGVLTAVYHSYYEDTGNVLIKIVYHSLITVFSISNSAFLLLAIPSIQVKKKPGRAFFKKDIKNVATYAIVILMGTIAIAFLIFDDASDFSMDIVPDSNNSLKQPAHFVGILDLLFAFIVIWELIIRMMQAFRERNMRFMLPVSWLFITFIFIAQVLDVLPAFVSKVQEWHNYAILQHFALLAYKTLFIALFILLSYSWQLKKNRANSKITLKDLEILTKQERVIFECLAKDPTPSHKDIGEALFITKAAVRTHTNHIRMKLGGITRNELIRAAKVLFPPE